MKIALIGAGASSGGLVAVLRDILVYDPSDDIEICLFCVKGFLSHINISKKIKVVETQYAEETKLEGLVRKKYNKKFIELIKKYNPDAVFYITGTAKMGLEGYKSYIVLNNQLYADIPLILRQKNFKLELGLISKAIQFRRNVKWMDGIFFSSNFSREHAKKIKTKKSQVISFACNSIFFSEYKEKILDIDKRHVKLLCIGSIIPYKNQKCVLMALHELQNRGIYAYVTFVGKVLSKKYYKECEKIIEKYSLQKFVTFLKWIKFDAVPSIIDTCAIPSSIDVPQVSVSLALM